MHHQKGSSTAVHGRSSVRWTPEDDARLREAIATYGAQGNWPQKARYVGKNLSADQVYQHWHRVLCCTSEPMSDAQSAAVLVMLVHLKRLWFWADIGRVLGTMFGNRRSGTQIRSRFVSLASKFPTTATSASASASVSSANSNSHSGTGSDSACRQDACGTAGVGGSEADVLCEWEAEFDKRRGTVETNRENTGAMNSIARRIRRLAETTNHDENAKVKDTATEKEKERKGKRRSELEWHVMRAAVERKAVERWLSSEMVQRLAAEARSVQFARSKKAVSITTTTAAAAAAATEPLPYADSWETDNKAGGLLGEASQRKCGCCYPEILSPPMTEHNPNGAHSALHWKRERLEDAVDWTCPHVEIVPTVLKNVVLLLRSPAPQQDQVHEDALRCNAECTDSLSF
eukprot:ANDGO_00415.mRNA.1 hypothetical protein